MKKVFLLTAVAGMVAFTSCKKEANEAGNAIENAVNETGDAIQSGAENAGDAIQQGAQDVSDATNKVYEDAKALVTDAPEIENDQLQEWVNKLHDAAVKAKAASKIGNQEELNEATATLTSLNESLSNYKDDPEYDKAQAYYEEIQAELSK